MNNNRNSRVNSAQQTLQIIENKSYQIEGKTIDLSSLIDSSVKNTKLYSPESFEEVLRSVDIEISKKDLKTTIIVENCTAMEATEGLLNKGRTGCLNFASAKNPGGGFLGGAQAQEESLARASALYPTQMKYFSEMYEYNRNRNTYLYSDYMIYSPDVVFFKDDSDHLLEMPYCMDILTSPAVNIGAMLQNKPKELVEAEETMLSRIDKILALFVAHNTENLILGAWGCGVFRNEPKDVARYFAHFLKRGGKYAKCFNTIIFATYDKSKDQQNIKAFREAFH